MQEKAERLKVSQDGELTIVELTDEKILDEIAIADIGKRLYTVVAELDNPRLILDFSKTMHLSSSALGMLITLHKRIREKDGQLRLCNIHSAIYEVFVITRLNEIFQIFQSREEAMENLS